MKSFFFKTEKVAFCFKSIGRSRVYIYNSIQQIAVEKAKCDDFLIIKETHTEQMTKPQLDC